MPYNEEERMINLKKNHRIEAQKTKLADELDSLISRFNNATLSKEEYTEVSNRIDAVIQQQKDLIEVQKADDTWLRKIDPNVLITGGISIASLLMIMNHEKTDIITTKAFGIATKWLGK